ncbi:hypothetical protein C8J57DRAFT_1220920 [Mycena rebaudengoi]|nr:hypothetical protein C8J57DRAFT_1220920 [Mycena rebaudengoi]
MVAAILDRWGQGWGVFLAVHQLCTTEAHGAGAGIISGGASIGARRRRILKGAKCGYYLKVDWCDETHYLGGHGGSREQVKRGGMRCLGTHMEGSGGIRVAKCVVLCLLYTEPRDEIGQDLGDPAKPRSASDVGRKAEAGVLSMSTLWMEDNKNNKDVDPKEVKK